MAAAKAFQWKEYFEYNPTAILEKGDVVIYYQSPQDTSGYGATYAFRGDEFLYINSWEGNGRTVEFGSNYMQHAKNIKTLILMRLGAWLTESLRELLWKISQKRY